MEFKNSLAFVAVCLIIACLFLPVQSGGSALFFVFIAVLCFVLFLTCNTMGDIFGFIQDLIIRD